MHTSNVKPQIEDDEDDIACAVATKGGRDEAEACHENLRQDAKFDIEITLSAQGDSALQIRVLMRTTRKVILVPHCGLGLVLPFFRGDEVDVFLPVETALERPRSPSAVDLIRVALNIDEELGVVHAFWMNDACVRKRVMRLCLCVHVYKQRDVHISQGV